MYIQKYTHGINTFFTYRYLKSYLNVNYMLCKFLMSLTES